MPNFPISHYTNLLRAHLPKAIFDPAPGRLVWLAVHLGIAATGIALVSARIGGLYLAIPMALVIGHSLAGMAFVAHETLHGAVVRDRGLRYLVGWVAFFPFCVSPRLWIAWHNRAHHGNTGITGIDPDAFPTLEEFHGSLRARITHYLTLGRGRWLGFVTLLGGFLCQSLAVLIISARKDKYLSGRGYLAAVLETGFAMFAITAFSIWIGLIPFLFAVLIPLVIANMIVMSYICTNHGLSALTEVNDPLVNSLTVTLPRPIELLHLNFGYHVEHHVFPAMSARHAHKVRDALIKLWPERYQSMPFFRAILRLATTGRAYSNPTTLHDPSTGREWPALQPRDRVGSEAVENAA